MIAIIEGFNNKYGVTETGKVWSWKSNKYLKPYCTGKKGNDYLTVRLYKNSRGADRKIHLLVLKTFVGLPPESMEACHNDGNRYNNKLSNLRWDTASSNTRDSIKHGTANCLRVKLGEHSPNHKLSWLDVKQIRYWYSLKKYTQIKLAQIYCVTPSTIWGVIHNKNWNNIED